MKKNSSLNQIRQDYKKLNESQKKRENDALKNLDEEAKEDLLKIE